jgi:hypothetical protein
MTWGEWLTSARDEIDAVKAIALAIGALVTAVLGWLGISHARGDKTKDEEQKTE